MSSSGLDSVQAVASADAASKKLLRQLVVVHRHGDRSPAHVIPKHKRIWEDLKLAPGQLSKTGAQQLRTLGAFLRERYVRQEDATDRQFLPVEDDVRSWHVLARSTDYDRTLQSAMALHHGLYPSLLKPIPVHTVPMASDIILNFMSTCASYKIAESRVRSSFEQLIEYSHGSLRDTLLQRTGWSEDDLSFAIMLDAVHDNLVCEKAHGLASDPELLELKPLLKKLSKQLYYDSYAQTPVNDPRGPIGTPLLSYILSSIKSAADAHATDADDSPQQPSLVHLSAHDTTLIGLFSALRILDASAKEAVDGDSSDFLLHPPYASSVVFELWVGEDGPHVEVFRGGLLHGQDSYFMEPLVVQCPDPSARCPLHEWYEYVHAADSEEGCCILTPDFYEFDCHSDCDPDSSQCSLYERFCEDEFYAQCPDVPAGFTLVELLAVVSVVGLLFMAMRFVYVKLHGRDHGHTE